MIDFYSRRLVEDFRLLVTYDEGYWKEARANGRDDINYHLEYADGPDGCKIALVRLQPTVSRRDWRSNFAFFGRRVKPYAGARIAVHRGFYQSYKAAASEIKAFCAEADGVYITGYSRGAAQGSICFEDLSYHFPAKKIWATLYEPPKAFTSSSVFLSNPLDKDSGPFLDWGNCLLVIGRMDPVCWAPPLGFKHFGVRRVINAKARWLPLQHYPDVVIRGLEEVPDARG